MNYVSATGFNSAGNDKNGLPRMAVNAKGKLVLVKFKKDASTKTATTAGAFTGIPA